MYQVNGRQYQTFAQVVGEHWESLMDDPQRTITVYRYHPHGWKLWMTLDVRTLEAITRGAVASAQAQLEAAKRNADHRPRRD